MMDMWRPSYSTSPMNIYLQQSSRVALILFSLLDPDLPIIFGRAICLPITVAKSGLAMNSGV